MNNLSSLLSSSFWKRGCKFFRHDPKTDTWEISGDIPWLQSNVNFYDNNYLDHVLNERTAAHNNKLRVDLLHLLSTSQLDQSVRRTIIEQCREIRQKIFLLDILPIQIIFILIPPGVYIPTHTHLALTKQTLSYIYTFHYDNPDNIVTINDIEYSVPVGERLFLNMYDNASHSFDNKLGWSFIWVCDYDKKVTITEEITKNFITVIKQN